MKLALKKMKILASLNKSTFFFIFLICCGSFIRIKDLSLYDFNYDDFWHLHVASQDSLFLVLKKNFEVEFHPPLSVILWHYALKISDNQMWLRSLSIFFGLALIPSCYVLGKVYIDRLAGYLLSYLVAFGYAFVVQSEVIRAYIFMIFFLVWMMIFVYRYLQKPKTKYLWLYFGFAFFAIELYHYSCIIVMFLSLSLLASCYKNKNYDHLKIVIFMNLLLLLLKIIYLTILINLSEEINNWSFGDSSNNYVNRLIIEILFYLFVSDNYFFSEKIILYNLLNGLFLFGFFYLIIKFIKEKKWHLLNMVFLPIIFSILMSFLNIIPHDFALRRISFLAPNQLLIIAILFTTLKNFLLKCLNEFNFLEYFKRQIFTNFSKITIKSVKLLSTLAICLCPVYFYSINAYVREKSSNPHIEDFVRIKHIEVKKFIFDELLYDDSNIMIITRSLKWQFLYKAKSLELKRINANLYVGKIENKELFFVSIDKFSNKYTWSSSFNDIKNYLSKNQRLHNKKNLIVVERCILNGHCGEVKSNFLDLNCRLSKLNRLYSLNDIAMPYIYEFNFYKGAPINYNFLKINFR